MENTDLLTVAGAAVVVTILLEVVKRALAWPPEVVERFGPLLAVVLGVVIAGAMSLYQGADIVQGVLTGLLAGASAIGIYENVKAGPALAGRG